MTHCSQLGGWHHGFRPAQARAVGPDPSQPSPDPFGDSRLFELAQGGQDVELQPASWRLQVDTFPEGHEANPEGLEFVQERHQVRQAAPQAVQAPHDDGVHLPLPGIRHESVQGGTAVLRARDAVIDILDALPPSRREVAPQFVELVLRFLVER